MKKILYLLIISILSNVLYAQEKKAVTTVNNEDVYLIVDDPAEFPGGEEARLKFLADNIQYPADAIKNNIQGVVYVGFIVETDGSISNVKVLRGIGGECDEEAMRVISMMPRWKPGKQDGKVVRVMFNAPIAFRLPVANVDKKMNKKKRKKR